MRYAYYCEDCGLEFDQDFPMGQATEATPCPSCREPVRRVYTAPVTIYKGTGWSGAGHGIPDMDEREKLPGPLDFSDLMED